MHAVLLLQVTLLAGLSEGQEGVLALVIYEIELHMQDRKKRINKNSRCPGGSATAPLPPGLLIFIY